MEIEEKKRKILDFIKTKNLAVMSTVSPDGLPEAAVIGISEMDDLLLIFGTFNTYRKYTNLKNNPKVAFVIGWDDITVQYEGVAEELIGGRKNTAKSIHLKKLPTSKKFSELKEQCYFLVKPTWIKYTDYSKNSIYGEFFEVNF